MTSHTVEPAFEPVTEETDVLAPHRRSRWSIVLSNPLAVIGGLMVLLWVLLAITAGWISPCYLPMPTAPICRGRIAAAPIITITATITPKCFRFT